MRGHRPLREEPDHAQGIPAKPAGISAGASLIWDQLLDEMDPRMLRLTDQRALWQLCEDEAILVQGYREFWQKTRGKNKSILSWLSDPNQRLAMSALRDVAARTVMERREFGLTPAARTRVSVDKKGKTGDLLDDAVFNCRAELLVLQKPN